jgi:hypothetical protein
MKKTERLATLERNVAELQQLVAALARCVEKLTDVVCRTKETRPEAHKLGLSESLPF